MLKFVLPILLTAAIFSSCGTEIVIEEKWARDSATVPPPGSDDNNPQSLKLTFDDDIKPLLKDKGCTVAGCHLNPAAATMPNFDNFESTKSFHEHPYLRVGHYGAVIDEAAKAKIEKWVSDGLLPNKATGGGGGDGNGDGNGNGLKLNCTSGSVYYDNCVKPELLTKKCLSCHNGALADAPDLSTFEGAVAQADKENFKAGHDTGVLWLAEEAKFIAEWISSGKKKDGTPPPALTTFNDDIRPMIMAKGCLGANCHGNAANPQIGTYAVAVQRSGTNNFMNGMSGRIWSPEEKDKITKWIADGTPETK